MYSYYQSQAWINSKHDIRKGVCHKIFADHKDSVTYWIDWGQVNRSVEVRVETLNPGTLTGKGRERWICDMMERWKVNWCTLYTGDHVEWKQAQKH